MSIRNKDIGCCGNCKHHKRDKESGEWICHNQESDNFGLEIEYSDSCVDFEEKKRKC